MKILVNNKKAFFNYEILEKFEAGISLLGCEVKALITSRGSLDGAFCIIRNNEVFILNMHISPYKYGDQNFNSQQNPTRTRKLLLNKNEIRKIDMFLKKHRATIVPLKTYFNHKKIKVEIAIARKKNNNDKRQAIKEKQEKREMKRMLKY